MEERCDQSNQEDGATNNDDERSSLLQSCRSTDGKENSEGRSAAPHYYGEQDLEEDEDRRTSKISSTGKSLEECSSVNLWQWHNLAIPVSYWVVGTLQGLFRTFLNVYPLDLGATEAQQTSLTFMATLPAAFKILYGFSSDAYPIAGYRRKSHLLLGWMLASIPMAILTLSSNLTLLRSHVKDHEADHSTIAATSIVPDNAPSLLQVSWSFFIFGVGMWYTDAIADAIVAEKARCEPEAIRGSLQATCYTLRFFGLMVSAPISTYLYSHVDGRGPQIIVQALAGLPCLVLPLAWCFAEQPATRTANQGSSVSQTSAVTVKPVREQCLEIWRTVCSRAVWEPMAFIYVFNLLQVSNAAWRQFLVSVLHFTPANLNSLLVASYVVLYLGTLLYKYFLLQASWRRIYQVCLVLNLVLSSLQLLLIRGHTLGISPFVFALGDDAFAEFLNGVQFLPAVILMVALCPPGSEGTETILFRTLSQRRSPNAMSMLASPSCALFLYRCQLCHVHHG